jgi:capsular exopolysaccharide synthesis family protein
MLVVGICAAAVAVIIGILLPAGGDRHDEQAKNTDALPSVVSEKANDRDKRDRSLPMCQEVLQASCQVLADKRKLLGELLGQAGLADGVSVASLAQSLHTLLAERQADLQRVESDLREAQALFAQRERKVPTTPIQPPETAKADVVPLPDSELQGYLKQLRQLQGQVNQILTIAATPAAGDKLVKERRLDVQIEEIKNALKNRQKSALVPRSVPPSPTETAGDLSRLEARVAQGEGRRTQLQKEIEQLARQSTMITKIAAKIEFVQKEIAAVEADLGKESDRVKEAEAVEPASPDRPARTEETAAVTPGWAPARWFYPTLAGLGTLLLGWLAFAWRDRRPRRIRSAAELADALAIPVMSVRSSSIYPGGEVPWYEVPDDSIDALRIMLTQPTSEAAGQVVLVTSALGSEGATSLAAQLAASLARSGRRTLLIDANLRRPALHQVFSLSAGPGLGEVLRGEASVNRVVRAGPLERLWVLPAGQGDAQAEQALSREGTLSFLDQLRKDYDFMVLDASPVVVVADALALSQQVDRVLLSVKAGVSRFPTVQAAWQRLAALGAPVLGAIVQEAPDAVARYNYPFRQTRKASTTPA